MKRLIIHKLNKKSRRLIFLLPLLLFSFASLAQDIKASAKLDSSNIKIGQQVKLELSILYRVDNGKQVKIQWPEIADTIRKEIEVISQSKVDTIIPDSADLLQFLQKKTLLLTSFDSGYWAITPFQFTINDSNKILTEPLLLEVNTVTVDTTVAIKDIKGIYQETYTWLDWLKDNPYIVYGALAAILLIILMIILIRHAQKSKPLPFVKETPKIPAHIIAFEKLEKLKNEKLWQEGKIKQYYSTLTDILREYIENRFKIQALEQTTDEILYGFRNVAIDEESKNKLKQVLILADLVKFAKEQPLANENELSMANSYDFVNGTKREEEEEISKQGSVNSK
ncbi:MAG: hypothetical protein ACT4ON_14870 [Bacteroidota bacterium]